MEKQGKTGAVILLCLSFCQTPQPHFLSLDSQAHLIPTVPKNKHQVEADQGLAGYQSPFQTSPRTAGPCKGPCAELHPTGQASGDGATGTSGCRALPGWEHESCDQGALRAITVNHLLCRLQVLPFPSDHTFHTVNRIGGLKHNTFISSDLTSYLEISQMKKWLHFPLQQEIPSQ